MKLFAILAMLLFTVTAAAASPSCMTLREARHAYHGEHLWWHPGDDGRCWDNTHGGHHKIHSSGASTGSRRAAGVIPEPQASVAPSPPEPSASMIEAAAATLGPRAIQIAMVGTTFNDRWPEAQPSISPLRWLREVAEFQ